jgi:mono/diheme cytochrome c family protein
MSLAAGDSGLARLAKSVADKLNWPGRPAPTVTVVPLTAVAQERYVAGAAIYRNVCAACHGDDGRGKQGLGGNLVESAYVTADDATAAIRILLSGKEGTIGLMPPLGPSLSDEQIASALTYVRRAWGHTGSAVDPLNVMETRGLSKSRMAPWTDAELQQGGRRGGGGRGRGRGGS